MFYWVDDFRLNLAIGELEFNLLDDIRARVSVKSLSISAGLMDEFGCLNEFEINCLLYCMLAGKIVCGWSARGWLPKYVGYCCGGLMKYEGAWL